LLPPRDTPRRVWQPPGIQSQQFLEKPSRKPPDTTPGIPQDMAPGGGLGKVSSLSIRTRPSAQPQDRRQPWARSRSLGRKPHRVTSRLVAAPFCSHFYSHLYSHLHSPLARLHARCCSPSLSSLLSPMQSPPQSSRESPYPLPLLSPVSSPVFTSVSLPVAAPIAASRPSRY
jgi:hypothetical protein